MKGFLFSKEPALLIGFASAALSLIAALGFHQLGAATVGLIVAVLNGLLGAAQAAYTRPVAPAAFVTLVAAVGALVAGFGFHVSPEVIGGVDALVVAFLSLVTRQQVSPMLALKAAKSG